MAAILLWSCSAVCFSVGSRALGPMAFMSCICLLGSISGTLAHVRGGGTVRELVSMPGRVWAAGFLGIVVYSLLLVTAFGIARDQDLAQVALVNYLWPILMVLIGLALLRERADARLAILGALLGFGGVVVARGLEALTQRPADMAAHGLALIAAVLWAAYSVVLKHWRVPEECNASNVQFAICAVLAGLIAALRGEWGNLAHAPASALAWTVFCGVGPVGLAYYWWEIGVKKGPTQLIAALSFSIPVTGSLLVCAVFRQALSPGLVPGAAMIAAGAYLARRSTAEMQPQMDTGEHG